MPTELALRAAGIIRRALEADRGIGNDEIARHVDTHTGLPALESLIAMLRQDLQIAHDSVVKANRLAEGMRQGRDAWRKKVEALEARLAEVLSQQEPPGFGD